MTMPDVSVSNSHVAPHADEITSVVIENGSSWTRVGYSGEGSPRHIFPTRYGKDRDNKYYFGNEDVNEYHAGKEIYSPLSDGIVQDWDGIKNLWNYVYKEQLDIDPSEVPLAVVEQTWNPSSNKVKAAEVAFEDLQVPLFSLIKSPLCAAYNSELPSALVIDIGSSVASVTPVIDGNILVKNAVHTKFAGDFITFHIMSSFRARNIPVTPSFLVKKKVSLESNTPADPENLYKYPDVTESFNAFQTERVIEEFKETTSHVSETPFNPVSSVIGRITRPFEFPDGFNFAFGPERLATVEPLFKPNDYPLPGIALPEGSSGVVDLVNLALANIPAELQEFLLNNIVLTGGTSLLQGFTARLTNELVALYPQSKVRVLTSSSHSTHKNTNWTGASILASMGNYDQLWVSKQEYEEFGAEVVKKRFK
ncbi:hypothetical protein DV113_002818 [Geotrichum candidum]|uniref:Similar to Saccharomyces cerevisiae YJL081C ARP4 Nuclear actin-related protein involved in chromatin remodeling n=1 Tax=Geotrichum candidum TaxID=1173061 RepID=A0A0J9X4U6_GEOCN|nr:hypothetical protein DV452_004574 [Geotrichum candidum]KAF7499128.1 hypothetical protein DV113_002818 [Geotrichum candidum]CDO52149.1 similar to Saccharomyces cerevisiae YJL081C ARP4 Nuclear actin-related protein involved in chromatin remodeling [Geotrichum candidum]